VSTSVDTQRTTGGYIPDDGTLHNHCCKNLRSHLKESLQRPGFEDLTTVAMKSIILRNVTSFSQKFTDVSEECSASIFRVEA
jgi:hypothetical protein